MAETVEALLNEDEDIDYLAFEEEEEMQLQQQSPAHKSASAEEPMQSPPHAARGSNGRSGASANSPRWGCSLPREPRPPPLLALPPLLERCRGTLHSRCLSGFGRVLNPVQQGITMGRGHRASGPLAHCMCRWPHMQRPDKRCRGGEREGGHMGAPMGPLLRFPAHVRARRTAANAHRSAAACGGVSSGTHCTPSGKRRGGQRLPMHWSESDRKRRV